jgi:hypothetical protein
MLPTPLEASCIQCVTLKSSEDGESASYIEDEQSKRNRSQCHPDNVSPVPQQSRIHPHEELGSRVRRRIIDTRRLGLVAAFQILLPCVIPLAYLRELVVRQMPRLQSDFSLTLTFSERALTFWLRPAV